MERKRIILSSGEKIPFENIKDLDSKLFEEIEWYVSPIKQTNDNL